MSIQNLAPLLVVGESTGTILLETVEDFRCATASMAAQGKRCIKLFTQELDHDLYDNDLFLQAVSAACRTQRNCTLSILLKDANKTAKFGHRLAELQKRIPSLVEIRSLPREHQDMNNEYLIVDDIAMVKRFALGHMRGHCEFRSIPDAVKFGRQFSEIWEKSLPCQELRRLSI
ncbi:hypothetical protein FT643_00475 [Ketobacter sp. MCCC 1A13808]|uniref:DUF7931 domain-containing protein n=1 Tax=Ketobacter sp. MCCC 1A13808 TaxID=2602738 RepID=UPI000F1AEF12|nr:hypothetical protein [Ketobacter sp. MCCC 1A13808]MVF10605.1 hypothetical protein [Ketobacter sp. MCCC 1A13808]RLP56028.1 MAG: hypothetical protein D6160_01100 [Ketobacter sp.]